MVLVSKTSRLKGPTGSNPVSSAPSRAAAHPAVGPLPAGMVHYEYNFLRI
jgi:hypothetical protein